MNLIKKLFGAAGEKGVEKVPARNEACWCGSGLKYKRCHLASDQERARGRSRTACVTS